MQDKITKGGILVVGDLHLSDKFQGRHRNYLRNCFEIMEKIEGMCEDMKADHGSVGGVILLGDLFGVREKRFTTREFMVRVYQFFQRLNKMTNGHVYSVRGNHDIAHDDLTDFDALQKLGLLKVPSYVDYVDGSSDMGTRFHFVHYGHETEDLAISANLSNVALGHNDFGLPGQPDVSWPLSKQSVDVATLENFCGVDLLLSGHIHTPPPRPSEIIMPDGSTMVLYYPGNPTRVSQKFEDCSAVKFFFTDDGIEYDPVPFNLRPIDEEFVEETEESSPSESSINEATSEALKTIVGNLARYGLVEGNLIHQIETRDDVKPEVRKLSVDFLERAMTA